MGGVLDHGEGGTERRRSQNSQADRIPNKLSELPWVKATEAFTQDLIAIIHSMQTDLFAVLDAIDGNIRSGHVFLHLVT